VWFEYDPPGELEFEMAAADQRAQMTDGIDLSGLLAVLRRRMKLIVAITVVVAAVTATVSLLQDATYTASTKLLYEPSAAVTALQPGSTPDQARMVATLAQIPGTATILGPVGKALRTPETDLERQVSVTSDANANLITIKASAPTAAGAQQLANAVARQFVAWREAAQRALLTSQVQTLKDELKTTPEDQAGVIETQLAETRAALANSTADLTIVGPARMPTSPSSPKVVRNTIIALLTGLLLGIIVALARDKLDRRLTTIEDAEAAYGLPLLGVVPFVAEVRGHRELGLADFERATPLADAYRAIRTTLVLYRLDRGTPHIVAVTSAVPGEGKSAAVANLAAALAAGGRSVLAISADLRAPRLHEYFPGSTAGSILDVLTGQRRLEDAVRRVRLGGPQGGHLDLLADGSVIPDPAALFGSARFASVLADAADSYDIVVLDAPPVMAAGETVALAQRADAVVVVAGLDRATRDSADRSRAFLAAAGVQPLGLIVTGWRNTDMAGYGYGYGHGYADPALRDSARA